MDIFTMDRNITGDTEGNVTCLNPRFSTSDWVRISLPIALFIIIFFSFLQPRKKLALECLRGRPGTVFPVDVLDTYTDRTTFTFAFCVCCVSILDLFVGDFYFNVDTTHLPSMVRGGVSILIGVVNVFVVGIVHYPLFLCLTVRIKLYGNIVGLMYSSFWTYFYYLGFVDCVKMGKWLSPENIVRNLAFFPIDVCYLLLIFRFLFGVIYYLGVCKNTCRKCHENNKKHETKMQDGYFVKTHFYRRVIYLLQPSKQRKSSHSSPSCFMLLVRKLYPSYPGFKYSRRIVCTISLTLLCLYEFGLAYTIIFSRVALEVKNAFVLLENSPLFIALDAADVSWVYVNFRDLIITLADTFIPTSVICAIFMALSTLHALAVYRRNTVRMWRGDRSSFPVRAIAYSKKVAANLAYSGYQIAYCIWGFIVLHFVLWLMVVVIWFFILGPLINDIRRDNIILQLLRDYWLGLVITLAIYYSQVLVSRLFFLQKYGKNFGINNRRSYHNMVYFTLFLNVLVGFASCILRILKAFLFGIFLLGRVDHCLMYPGLEFFDTGYKAYVGFLELEVIHTHPVIVTFCNCLWEVARTENDRRTAIEKTEDEHEVLERKRKKVIRNKWQLGYTLVRNPILLRDRLSNLIDYQREIETGNQNGGFTIDMDSVEENPDPPFLSEDDGAVEMKPSNRGGCHGDSHLVAVKVEEYNSRAIFPDGKGNGNALQGDHQATKDSSEKDSAFAGNQQSRSGKGNPAGDVQIGYSSPCAGDGDMERGTTTEGICQNTAPKNNDQSEDVRNGSCRTPESSDTGTEIFMQADPNLQMHHEPDDRSHTEATELPVDSLLQQPRSLSDKGSKTSECRNQQDGSTRGTCKDSDGNSLDSSRISVFGNQSFEELIKSSVDPEHIADCRENGVDLVRYVEEEMWKNLLHEGTSTLKRAKQEEHRRHEEIEEQNLGLTEKGNMAEMSIKCTKNEMREQDVGSVEGMVLKDDKTEEENSWL